MIIKCLQKYPEDCSRKHCDRRYGVDIKHMKSISIGTTLHEFTQAQVRHAARTEKEWYCTGTQRTKYVIVKE